MRKPNTLSTRIRAVRKAAKLTQAEFAQEVGVEQATVSRWESGAEPTFESIQAVLAFAQSHGLDAQIVDYDPFLFNSSTKARVRTAPVLGRMDGDRVEFETFESYFGSVKFNSEGLVRGDYKIVLSDIDRIFNKIEDIYSGKTDEFEPSTTTFGPHHITSTEELFALQLTSNRYYPIIDPGSWFYVPRKQTMLFEEFTGRLVLAMFQGGEAYVGRLFPGSDKRRFTLVTLNGHTLNATIAWAAPVRMIALGDADYTP